MKTRIITIVFKDFTYFSGRKVNYEYVLKDFNCNFAI